ncbi:MAG TPA: hypothetical protein VGQ26_30155, partial [Streptosporangiaceae bacterium]|nr:hypothetical protein [Streptosporangiaceae bacterium]
MLAKQLGQRCVGVSQLRLLLAELRGSRVFGHAGHGDCISAAQANEVTGCPPEIGIQHTRAQALHGDDDLVWLVAKFFGEQVDLATLGEGLLVLKDDPGCDRGKPLEFILQFEQGVV